MRDEGQKLKNYLELNKEAEHYIREILSQEPTADYPYHNLNHTLKVVFYAEFLAKEEQLMDSDVEIIKFAAWFHDSGYSISYFDHEENGILLAREFLQEKSVNNGFIIPVENMIRATKMPQKPRSLAEMILCDADMFHLSEDDIVEQSLALMKEWNMVNGHHIPDHKYLRTTLKLLMNHSYFTEYGKKVLEEKKRNNLRRVMDYLNYHL